ncbi:MAG: ABC transporter substrate-binding protein [Gemmatimonadota bacterium]|nr:ABC transporter substrate-binding protein [Gemmatimonadota bacterium]
MRRSSSALFLVAAAIGATACARPGGGAGRTERVVCVSKQINEFMFAIGAQDLLVGRDLTSIYPPAITKITSVGYHRALNAEGIISLRPTVFLNDGNYGPDEVKTQLQKVGIPILTLNPGTTLDGAEALLDTLGTRFDRRAAADSVLAAWKAGMDSIYRDTLQWAGKPRPRVLIMHFGQLVNDYLALKRGGVADHILDWAGGVNAVDSVGGMMRLTPELIAKIAPDVIIATDVGFDRFGTAQKFATMPGVSLTPAGRHGRIYRIEETDVMYFGPRTPAAVRRMAGFLHPSPPAR